LRASQLGTRVRRQVVLEGAIVDFFVPAAKLVIEVDGGYHGRRVAADARRDARLWRAGYRVMRVDAEAVMLALPSVLREIAGRLG
jgi:very-short-patch-repair endonuclease